MAYTGDAGLDAALGLGVESAAAGAGAQSLIAGATPLAWFQAASPILGKAMGPSSAGPSRADSSAWTNATFDNSGFTVATGNAKATSTPPLPWTWILVAAVAGLLVWKRA